MSERYVMNGEVPAYKTTELAIEMACMRGDLNSIKNNPIAIKALKNALDPSVRV